MTSPFHKVVRKIRTNWTKPDTDASALKEAWTAKRRSSRTSLSTAKPLLSAVIPRWGAFDADTGKTQGQTQQSRAKISEKAAHLLSKPGVPKMLRDKLSGECLAIEASHWTLKEEQQFQGYRHFGFGMFLYGIPHGRCSHQQGSDTREKVALQEFISRGAFGKVYKGTYNGQLVAVKTMSDVDSFVKEIKMACTMSHPNIVQFIGVASAGKYEEENRRTGFDAAKITIALHVAHALAYFTLATSSDSS
ncbi:Protein kinase-like domain [Phytophthora cactorum]|nr:Protein kinase-like domain [Phytophthora cactorum]